MQEPSCDPDSGILGSSWGGLLRLVGIHHWDVLGCCCAFRVLAVYKEQETRKQQRGSDFTGTAHRPKQTEVSKRHQDGQQIE